MGQISSLQDKFKAKWFSFSKLFSVNFHAAAAVRTHDNTNMLLYVANGSWWKTLREAKQKYFPLGLLFQFFHSISFLQFILTYQIRVLTNLLLKLVRLSVSCALRTKGVAEVLINLTGHHLYQKWIQLMAGFMPSMSNQM